MKSRKQLLQELKQVKDELEHLKHLQGRHNQLSHGRGGGRTAGGGGGNGASGGYKPKFNKDEWAKKDDPRGEWGEMPVAERDAIADATRSVKARQNQLLEGMPPRPNTGDLKADIAARTDHLKDRVGTEERQILKKTMDNYADTLEKAGIKPEHARELVMEGMDCLAAQDIESLGRTLGDHGVRHISGNIEMAESILNSRPDAVSAKENAIAQTAMLFHDSGYMTPPSQNFLDEGHPRWSAQHFDANVRPLVEKAMGTKAVGEVQHIIRTHDSTDMDWGNDPVASACRVADNMALFRREKLPGVFKQVDGNLQVLKDVGSKRISVEEGQKRMRKNIQDSGLPPRMKEQMMRAANETNKYTAKFTLGMLGGEVAGVSWTRGHVKVKIKESPEVTELNKLGEFDQRQFAKLAETYGYPKDYFKKSLSFEFKNPKTGQVVLESEVERFRKALISAMRKMQAAQRKMKRNLYGEYNEQADTPKPDEAKQP